MRMVSTNNVMNDVSLYWIITKLSFGTLH